MVKSIILTKDSKPSADQIADIRASKNRPIVYDDDCPKLSEDQLRQFGKPKKRWEND